MSCWICTREPSRFGVLCEPCRDALRSVAITGEQIQGVVDAASTAALIDVWGGVHRLSPDTLVGRAQHVDVLAIYEPSVSRRHAHITQEPEGWTVQDLGSANGTFVDDRSALEAQPVRRGSRVRFGDVTFYFMPDVTGFEVPSALEVMAQTARPSKPLAPEEVSGPREMAVRLFEPSGGGGGIVEFDGRTAHLTLAQYELMSRLIARMVEDSGKDPADRGYISSERLVAALSLDSLQPNEDNVRQLVRRVRRRLLEAGIGDIIESKYGRGYRLNITPRLV